MNSNWGPAAIIVFGYVAASWQSKRFEDLKDGIKAEVGRVEGTLTGKLDTSGVKLDGIDKRLASLEVRVGKLEDAIRSPLIKA